LDTSPSDSRCWLQAFLISGHEEASGVRKEERPLRPSSTSESRFPRRGGAAGASIAILWTVQFISAAMRATEVTTPRAASLNGVGEATSLFPKPRGMAEDISIGIGSGS